MSDITDKHNLKKKQKKTPINFEGLDIGLAVILVIMSVSTYKIAIILYF
jgi:hypothetical protein